MSSASRRRTRARRTPPGGRSPPSGKSCNAALKAHFRSSPESAPHVAPYPPHGRVRPRLRHSRAAAAGRAGGALAPPADPRRDDARAWDAAPRGGIRRRRGARRPRPGVPRRPPVRRRHRAAAAGVRARPPRTSRCRGDPRRRRCARPALRRRVVRPRLDDVGARAHRRPVTALREARRVLVPNGGITAIEVDYSTVRAEPSTPALEALFRAMVQGMAAAGWSDAGTRLPEWLAAAGFRDIDEGERTFWWQGEELETQAAYAADVVESAMGSSRAAPRCHGARAPRRARRSPLAPGTSRRRPGMDRAQVGARPRAEPPVDASLDGACQPRLRRARAGPCSRMGSSARFAGSIRRSAETARGPKARRCGTFSTRRRSTPAVTLLCYEPLTTS